MIHTMRASSILGTGAQKRDERTNDGVGNVFKGKESVLEPALFRDPRSEQAFSWGKLNMLRIAMDVL